MKKLIIGLAALLISAAPVVAQEVGTTQWNGYPVVLKADGTWYFDCGGYGATLSKEVRMAFCFDPNGWNPGEPQDTQEFVSFSADDTVGLGIITEAQVFSAEDLMAAVLANAAQNNTSSGKPDGVAGESVEINGHTWATATYTAVTPDAEFSYKNYHISGENFGTAQVVFFTLKGGEAAIEEKAKAFLSQVVFGG